jgi:hypothetical protein
MPSHAVHGSRGRGVALQQAPAAGRPRRKGEATVSDATGTKRWTPKDRVKGPGEYIGAIIGAVIGVIAVNIYPVWQPWTMGVVTDAWPRILWAANLSLVINICGNFMLLFWRPRWLRNFAELVFSAAGLLSIAVFFAVFPLDFSRIVGEWLNTMMRVILIIGIAGAGIGVVINLVRFLVFSWRKD